MKPLLEINNLFFSYGKINVLNNISITIYENEIVTLLGVNGAGKTTTLTAISGLYPGIKDGTILFNDQRIDNLKPHKIASLGIAQCLEGRRIFSHLTVKENLMLGTYCRKCNTNEIQDDLNYVFELFPKLKIREKQKGGTLSGGEQQMLAVGRALMQKPKLLLMDEPSLGLAPIIVDDIFSTIQKINKNGVPILLVEQNCHLALNIASRGYVLENGNIILEDTANNLKNNPLIQKSYMGMD